MEKRQANRKLAGKLLLISASMFAFGVFAMPPLYEKFCEITGIGQAGVKVATAENSKPTGETANSQRSVKVFFDATANSALPWEFKPVQRSMMVQLGKPSVSAYEVISKVEKETAGQAVYNVTPPEAAPYFVKTECFCFSRQQLAALEQKEMPVRFYIESGLPENISEITLSYTFFLNEDSDTAQSMTQRSGNN